MKNITDEMAVTDAKKVKVMRTSVGWLRLVLLAIVRAHLTVLEVVLHSSKSYAIGAKFRQ
eukprot:5929208-Pleurochrysis_carterae.AAC.2